ncbi:glutathione S-transferase T1-like [Miscanthus floridulus]|uniref:glutathione S-transferase T1-like n=1 Tax=Miscanthus floridulus TaxID=154761 RepID=UPI0034577EC5
MAFRYPADLFTRAKIESILDWHHSNLRLGAGTFVYYTALAPFLGLRPRPDATKHAEKVLMQSLARIESVWLKGDAKFLLGSPQPSIADLSLVCEIMQLEMVPTPPSTITLMKKTWKTNTCFRRLLLVKTQL